MPHATRRSATTTIASCLVLGALVGFPAAASASSFSLSDLVDDVRASQQPEEDPSESSWGILSGIAREGSSAEVGVAAQERPLSYEAAGIAVDLPEPLDVMGVPGVFVMASYGDLFVALSQADHDFAASDGRASLEEYLDGVAEEGFATYTATLADGTPVFGCTRETDGMVAMEVYLAAADGSLATLWLEYPVDQGDEYIELSACVYDSLRLAPAADALPEEDCDTFESDGISFAADGLAYDEAAGMWCDADETLMIATSPNLLLHDEDVPEDRFLDTIASFAQGIPISRYIVGIGEGSDLLYVVNAVDEAGVLETLAFTALDDGTATLLYGVCDATDADACRLMGSVLESVRVVREAPEGVLGSLLGHLDARTGWPQAQRSDDGDDLSYLLLCPTFVGTAKMA